MSKLDQQENIGKPFNAAANTDLQKRLAGYDLSKEEHSKIGELQKERDAAKQQEKESFNNPDEFNKRLSEKYAELQKANQERGNGQPGLNYNPPGMGQRNSNGRGQSQHLMQRAAEGIKQDSQNKLRGYDQNCNTGVNQVLERAAQDGRGPQQETSPSQDQSRGQDQSQDRDR